MDKIKLITDSASDILAEHADRYHIHIMPIPIAVDGQSFLERVDFNAVQFYDILEKAKEIPVTSHITPVAFMDAYERFYAQGYNHIICVTINSKGSTMYEAAQLGRQLFFDDNPDAVGKVEIHVIDSLTYSVGYGYGVTQAARMAQEGASIEEVLAYLDDYFDTIEVYLTIYSLEYAKKSGRIRAAAAFVGELLGLRPLMKIKNGEITIVEKVRGDKAILNKLVDTCERLVSQNRKSSKDRPFYLVARGTIEETGMELCQTLQKRLGYPPEDYYYLGASITINSGPKAVGFAARGESLRAMGLR